jgi:hypothetical protein
MLARRTSGSLALGLIASAFLASVATAGEDYKGSYIITAREVVPNLARCGAPPAFQMSYTATGADDLGGVFLATVSQCLDLSSFEETPVWDAQGALTYANGRGGLVLVPEAWTQVLVPATCVQTSDHPIRAQVVGGTGEFDGARGHWTSSS